MENNQNLAGKVLNLIDLTSLNEGDTDEQIIQLCHSASSEVGDVAALCIYPRFIPLANKTLNKMQTNAIKIATVVNFPAGGIDVERTVAETETAVRLGADEVDMVLPYRDLEQGNVEAAGDMVKQCKSVCGDKALLKVIIESGELKTPELIRSASEVVIANGADFIKTSTGKVPINATLDAAKIMLECIKNSGKPNVGFKAAGGIRTMQEALSYLKLAEDIMGQDWLTPEHFRFGASSLLNSVLQFAGMFVSKTDSTY